MWRRTGALEAKLTRVARQPCGWDLDALSDEELEALMPLSEKQAAADESGKTVDWTPDELALLKELAAKAGASR